MVPTLDQPMNPVNFPPQSNEYKFDKPTYVAKATDWTKKYATDQVGNILQLLVQVVQDRLVTRP